MAQHIKYSEEVKMEGVNAQLRRFLISKSKILTVFDRPLETDAFEYYLNYLPKETIFGKTKDVS